MDFEGGAKDIVLRGIAAIITCIILIFLLVFFTNREKLRERFAVQGVTDAATGIVTVEQEGSHTEYGIRIGDNLKAFIADDTFFDDYTVIPVTEDYTEEEVISVSILAASEEGDLVIRLFDGDGTVIKGVRFKATVSREEAGRPIELVFIDDDEDGVIRAKGLTNGEWKIMVQELEGYHMPTQGATITLGSGDNVFSAPDASAGDSTDDDADTDADDDTDDDNADGGADSGDTE